MTQQDTVTEELLDLVTSAVENGLMEGDVGFAVVGGELLAETYGDDGAPVRRWSVTVSLDEVPI